MANKPQLVTLNSGLEFHNLLKTGRKIYPSHWLVVNVSDNPDNRTKYGWTLPRYVGTAVVRNRLKRWCRHFLRSHVEVLGLGVSANFVFRKKDKAFYKKLENDEFQKTLHIFFNKIKSNKINPKKNN